MFFSATTIIVMDYFSLLPFVILNTISVNRFVCIIDVEVDVTFTTRKQNRCCLRKKVA
jgi:hypothetical protein